MSRLGGSGMHDWDADFRRNAIGGIVVRDLELKAATVAYAPLQEMVERMFTSADRVGIVAVLDHQIAPTDPAVEARVVGRRHFRLDPAVPFGHVYEFESMEAYELWQEWGSPRV